MKTKPHTLAAAPARAAHTPGNLVVFDCRNGTFQLEAADSQRQIVATVHAFGALERGNADHMALCWNSHDGLVEALLDMIFDRLGDEWPIWADRYRDHPNVDKSLLRALDLLALVTKGAA